LPPYKKDAPIIPEQASRIKVLGIPSGFENNCIPSMSIGGKKFVGEILTKIEPSLTLVIVLILSL
jgi:hypothetical protein